MNSLVPPNATPLERAFAEVCVAMLAFDAPLATLANPDTIPAKFLPWLAWSLGVRTWKSYWSDAVKRSRVRHAIEIAKRQGTVQAIEDVVTSFGGHVQVSSWFEQDPIGEPYTFQMTIRVTEEAHEGTYAAFVDDIIAEVRRAKSARDHFTFTQHLNARGALGVVAMVRPVAYAHLVLQEAN